MPTGRKSTRKPAAKKKAPAKRKVSLRRNSPARQRVLDTALTMGSEMAIVPADAIGVKKKPARPKKPRKVAAKKSLGQRIRKFVEKQLG